MKPAKHTTKQLVRREEFNALVDLVNYLLKTSVTGMTSIDTPAGRTFVAIAQTRGISDIQISGVLLQVKYDGDTEWTTIHTGSECA